MGNTSFGLGKLENVSFDISGSNPATDYWLILVTYRNGDLDPSTNRTRWVRTQTRNKACSIHAMCFQCGMMQVCVFTVVSTPCVSRVSQVRFIYNETITVPEFDFEDADESQLHYVRLIIDWFILSMICGTGLIYHAGCTLVVNVCHISSNYFIYIVSVCHSVFRSPFQCYHPKECGRHHQCYCVDNSWIVS